MVDSLTCGFSALQTLRDQDLPIVIHAHRAGNAAFTRNPKHGISMRPIAKVARIIGVDQIHVGTVVGKMSETNTEVVENVEAVKMPMHGLKQVLPVASGGLHPRLVPALIQTIGNDVVIQSGGGIHGHEAGTEAGARAMRQAIDGTIAGKGLEEYSKDHKELRIALGQWKN